MSEPLPDVIGLCPLSPAEFYVPHGGVCPECSKAELVVYTPAAGLYVCANGHRCNVTRGYTEHERRCFFCGKIATPIA